MDSIFKKNINDLSDHLGSEIEQSLMRLLVIIGTGLFLYFWILPQNYIGSTYSIIFSAIYITSSFLLLISIKLKPELSNIRIFAGMLLDIAATSAFMSVGEQWMLSISWFYILLIVGNGFRFGLQHLDVALALSLIGFTIACIINDYWINNIIHTISIYLSILILSFYVRILLKRLTQAVDAANTSAKIKSEFLANMSHEIRTPMNGVLGMLELTLNDPLDKPQRKRLTIAKNSADALLVLLNDILDLSKIEAGKINLEIIDFNLKKLLKEVVSLLEPRANEKGITLSYTFKSNENKHFKGDPTRIRQIIINLLGNAIKFTDNGSVEIEISVIQQQDTLLQCKVKDSGIGISEEAQQRIFNYFTQADASTTRNYGGTGLGLALSQRLVNEMGGEMKVISELGKGSIFSFSLPLQQTEAKKSEKQEEKPRQKNKGKINILIAEDNMVNQIVIEQMLTQLGCKSTIKNNGQLLIDTIVENPQHDYDLILMDCQMPQVDGYEATRYLQNYWQSQQNSRIPIVALTANVMPKDKKKCLDSGMDDYLAKPIKMESLLAILDKWVYRENKVLQKNENSSELVA